VAHHQIVFKLKRDNYQDAISFCKKTVSQDKTDLRRETTALFNFFTDKVGDIVDLNLDYFPDMIIVTFTSHHAVVKALSRREPDEFKFKSSTMVNESKEPKYWIFEASKIDFTCHVRNCNLSDDSPPSKYLPIYVQQERMQLARQYLSPAPSGTTHH